MRKAKVILTVVSLITIVGGALAFKAYRISGSFFCSTIPTTGPCPIIVTTNLAIVGPVTFLYCGTLYGEECTQLITVKTTD